MGSEDSRQTMKATEYEHTPQIHKELRLEELSKGKGNMFAAQTHRAYEPRYMISICLSQGGKQAWHVYGIYIVQYSLANIMKALSCDLGDTDS